MLGETEAIAREKADYLMSLVPPEMVVATTSAMLGADLSKVGNEAELRDAKGHAHNAFKIELARRATVRALKQAAESTPQSQANKKIR